MSLKLYDKIDNSGNHDSEEETASKLDCDISSDEFKRQRLSSWAQLLIGIPAFMGLVYLMYWIMKQIV